MDLSIDPDSAVAPYEQLRAQVAEQAASGALPAGTRLPPVRTLAAQLGLAANTVARTYRELERLGIIETHGRNGSVIAAGDSTRHRLELAAADYASTAERLGVASTEALAVVQRALARSRRLRRPGPPLPGPDCRTGAP